MLSCVGQVFLTDLGVLHLSAASQRYRIGRDDGVWHFEVVVLEQSVDDSDAKGRGSKDLQAINMYCPRPFCEQVSAREADAEWTRLTVTAHLSQ